MHKLIYLAAALLLGGALAWAQVIPTPSVAVAACAYNSSPPAPTAGKFYLIQCNSSGQLLTAYH